MESQLLAIPMKFQLDEYGKSELDSYIENMIQLHKNNAAMITKFALDSVTVLTASEEKAKALHAQGFFKRIFENDDIRHAQYIAFQILQRLLVQQLFTVELVTVIKNKLDSYLHREIIQYFNEIGSELLRAPMDQFAINKNLLFWTATIGLRMFNGKEYCQLSLFDKMICLTSDFFRETNGTWRSRDLTSLLTAMMRIGLDSNKTFLVEDFYKHISSNSASIDRFFEGIEAGNLKEFLPIELPVAKGMEKLLLLNREEEYDYQDSVEQLNKFNVPVNERELKWSLVQQYLENYAFSDLHTEITVYDFSLELLFNLLLLSGTNTEAETERSELLSVLDVTLNRDIFEIEEEVKERMEGYPEIKVGKAYLRPDMYDIQKGIYKLSIDGNSEAESLVVKSDDYYTEVLPKEAKQLYESGGIHPVKMSLKVNGEKDFAVSPHIEGYKMKGGIPTRLLKRIPFEEAFINKIVVNERETHAAVVCAHTEIRILDIQTGMTTHTIRFEKEVRELAFSGDEAVIILTDTSMSRWNIITNEKHTICIKECFADHKLSLDGKFAANYSDSSIMIYDTNQLEPISKFRYNQERFVSFYFSKRAEKLYFVTSDQIIASKAVFRIKCYDITRNKVESLWNIEKPNTFSHYCKIYIIEDYLIFEMDGSVEIWDHEARVKLKQIGFQKKYDGKIEILEGSGASFLVERLTIASIQPIHEYLVLMKDEDEKFAFYFDFKKDLIVHQISVDLPVKKYLNHFGAASTTAVIGVSDEEYGPCEEILVLG